MRRPQIVIDYDGGQLREKPDFLTFSKVKDTMETVERSADNHEEFLYTISLKKEKALGVSTIISSFGNVLQKWEKNGERDETQEAAESSDLSENPDTSEELGTSEKLSEKLPEKLPEKPSEGLIESDNSGADRNMNTPGKPDTSEKQETSEKSQIQGEASEDIPGAAKENNSVLDDTTGNSNTEIPTAIRNFQRRSWEKRQGKPFVNFDRIALFQMNIDSSYYPPDLEICSLFKEEERADSYRKSCAEFRRRKLLAPVFEACHALNVEILLLPEYSVRPETVEWIREEIEEKDYHFAVWAGTFRIPSGYQFDPAVWNEANLNTQSCWHSALLPIVHMVIDEEVKSVKIEAKRFKKYPAVALHEDINPGPAFKSNFRPVIKKIYGNKQAGDARDDVTELICAEMFAVSAVCNYPSFLKCSLDAYNRYAVKAGTGGTENTTKQMKKDTYQKQMVNDLFEFGKYTAIYQDENRWRRTPIILVPACTTRATDYYVWAQGDYLAAGLKTVFCNPSKKEGIGGSCFIGQNSWDDNKLNHDERKLSNTIYHGLTPGMYMQSMGDETDKSRGALGPDEQALLVYDINPYGDKMSPNAESMIDSLSIVAHIPILEGCVKHEVCKKCRNNYLCEVNEDTVKINEVIRRMNKIEEHCRKAKNTTMNETKTEAAEMGECLKKMGTYCSSKWLKKRGEFYKKYYSSRPQGWVPPALVDWMYITIDYREFIRDSDRYCNLTE